MILIVIKQNLMFCKNKGNPDKTRCYDSLVCHKYLVSKKLTGLYSLSSGKVTCFQSKTGAELRITAAIQVQIPGHGAILSHPGTGVIFQHVQKVRYDQ